MRKLKIFKFRLGQTVDLTHTPEFGCNVIQCGKNRFTLKDFRVQYGHDDSLPYSAILCIDDKPMCHCLNTGYGEQTDLKALDIPSKALMASADINVSRYKWSYMGTEFNLRLDFIADTLACSLSHGF